MTSSSITSLSTSTNAVAACDRSAADGRRCPTPPAVQCVLEPEGLEEVVDEVIRFHLPGLLSTDAAMTVVGAFGDSGDLAGVVAWHASDMDGVAFMPLLAVRFGQQHHGIGRGLKEYALNRCRELGYRAVRSVVHRDNKVMVSLNERLGGQGVPRSRRPAQELLRLHHLALLRCFSLETPPRRGSVARGPATSAWGSLRLGCTEPVGVRSAHKAGVEVRRASLCRGRTFLGVLQRRRRRDR